MYDDKQKASNNLADLLEAETVDNIFASDRWEAVPLIARLLSEKIGTSTPSL